VWETYGEAVGLLLRGATARVSLRVAAVVGTWLVLVNQGGSLLKGHINWPGTALNYLTPFVVASLGNLAARRRRNVERLCAQLSPPTRPPSPGREPGRGVR
jgi:hypothetical protein